MPSRSLRALLVDVGPSRQAEIADALTRRRLVACTPSRSSGTEALSAALARRGWDVVIYGGEGARAGPGAQGDGARADGRPAAGVRRRGAVGAAGRPLRVRAGLRPRGDHRPRPRAAARGARGGARRRARRAARTPTAPTGCCSPSRRSPITSPPGLAPDELCARVLATLGETLGWTYGAVWRPDGESSMLRAAALWHDPAAGPDVAAFADISRRLKIAPGRGLPGRAYAFRRSGVGRRRARRREHAAPRARRARRAEHRGRVPDRARPTTARA